MSSLPSAAEVPHGDFAGGDDDGSDGGTSPMCIQDAVDAAGWNRVTSVMLVLCGLYWLCDAIELGLMSYLVPVLMEEWQLQPSLSDAIASIVFSGIMVGSLLFGFLSDRFGRRLIFLVTAAGTGLFGLASAFSPGIAVMLVLRFLCGVFLGGAPAAYGMYLEFLPRHYRWLTMYFNLFFTVGSLFEAVLAWGVLPTLGWRYLVAFSSAPIALLCFGFPFLVESPQWLLATGKDEKAAVVMGKMFSRSEEAPPSLIRSPVLSTGSVLELFSARYRRRTLLLAPIWFIINLIYYGVIFFTVSYFILIIPSGGSEETDALVLLIVVTLGEIPGALVCALLVNRISRRALTLVMMASCALFMFLLLATENVYARAAFSLLSRASIFGAFATIYLWTPEVFPTRIRTTSLGVCSSFGKIASIAAPFVASRFSGSDDVLVPVCVFGGAAVGSLVLIFFVNSEPGDLTDVDEETTKLLD